MFGEIDVEVHAALHRVAYQFHSKYKDSWHNKYLILMVFMFWIRVVKVNNMKKSRQTAHNTT